MTIQINIRNQWGRLLFVGTDANTVESIDLLKLLTRHLPYVNVIVTETFPQYQEQLYQVSSQWHKRFIGERTNIHTKIYFMKIYMEIDSYRKKECIFTVFNKADDEDSISNDLAAALHPVQNLNIYYIEVNELSR